MPRLLFIAVLIFFAALSAYRYARFTPPPPPPAYPYVTPYPGIGYTPLDTRRDVTYLVDNLALPVSVSLAEDASQLFVTQATGETLAFSKAADGSFSTGPLLYYESVPTPIPGPDLATLVARHPTAIEKNYPGQTTNALTDPATGYIYFADYLEGRLYRIK